MGPFSDQLKGDKLRKSDEFQTFLPRNPSADFPKSAKMADFGKNWSRLGAGKRVLGCPNPKVSKSTHLTYPGKRRFLMSFINLMKFIK